MTPPPSDELRSLRERAYGPAADIDEAALRRLRELEDRPRASGRPPAPTSTEDRTDAVAPVASAPAEHVVEAVVEPAAPAPPTRADRRRRRERTRVALWIGSLLVALVIVGTAATLIQRVQTDPLQVGATQVMRLGPDPSFDTGEMFGQGAQGYAPFYGIRPLRTPQGFPGDEATDTCLTILEDQEFRSDNSFSGFAFGGCGAGAFPASAQFLVTQQMPEELRARFPAGTALQFVYDDASDEVVVFHAEE